MPRLVFLTSAQNDLAEIAAYIERESQSRTVAEAFVDKIVGHCEHMATLTTQMGRARPELRAEYRSVLFGNYVIFIRYKTEGIWTARRVAGDPRSERRAGPRRVFQGLA